MCWLSSDKINANLKLFYEIPGNIPYGAKFICDTVYI